MLTCFGPRHTQNRRQERAKVGLLLPCEPEDGPICGAISVFFRLSEQPQRLPRSGQSAREGVSGALKAKDSDDALQLGSGREQRPTQCRYAEEHV